MSEWVREREREREIDESERKNAESEKVRERDEVSRMELVTRCERKEIK